MKFLLPIPLIDIEKAESESFRIRRGKENEFYVFNQSGQLLDKEALAVIYSPPELEGRLSEAVDFLKREFDGFSITAAKPVAKKEVT